LRLRAAGGRGLPLRLRDPAAQARRLRQKIVKKMKDIHASLLYPACRASPLGPIEQET
jgi:hypothetical protein